MNKFDVLRCTQGSMTSFDPLTPENFPKYAEEGLTYEEAAKIFSEAGLSIEKVVVDPKRSFQKMYYADFESGQYFDVHLGREWLLDEQLGLKLYAKQDAGAKLLAKRDWETFYFIAVPTPMQIYDFQRRYKSIEPERVFSVWSGIHQHMDYANGQWNPKILDYVFDHALEEKDLPLNENGTVTVYRGGGKLSQPVERALSWSTNRINALWFANRSGRGQAVYVGEVRPENVIAYFGSFREENEVLVRPGKVENVRKLDLIPVTEETMVRLLAPVLPELTRYGSLVPKYGYNPEGLFRYHGRDHILRVLTLTLIYFYGSGDRLSKRDKAILIYFALLHDVGRDNEKKDPGHGKKSVVKILSENLSVPGIEFTRTERDIAYLLIRYHSRPDNDGYAAIRNNRKWSEEDRKRITHLYQICKDMDGLDRVRFNGLDMDMLRTPFAKRLPLVAGALLEEEISEYIKQSKKMFGGADAQKQTE